MTITENFLKISELEERLKRDEKTLAEREASLTAQLLDGDNFCSNGAAAQALAGLEVLKRLWPERQARQKAKIFALQSQIDAMKSK